jgi:hypothetical protein|tara:strand:- start:126 stop:305 length:180 start_codon:yes stop_codon:yes gene_type:complete
MEKVNNEDRLNAIAVELQSLFSEFENIYKGSLEKMNKMTEEIDEELSFDEELSSDEENE